MGMQVLNLATIIYQGQVKPLKYRLENRVELANEFLINLATTHIILYTDFI